MGKKTDIWMVRITPELDNILEEAVEKDAHLSKSEYIREAVRRELERDGFYRTEKESAD